MKRYLVLGLTLAVLAASTAVDAQVGGLLRKKAGEVMGKKPEPAKPAPAPTPEPAPAGPGTTTATVTPAPAPAATGTGATATPAKPAGSPLDPTNLPIRDAANQLLRDRISSRESGDWNSLPYIPAAAVAAAYGLNDSARVTLVETLGAALKAFVMSAAYVAEHDAYVKGERKGVVVWRGNDMRWVAVLDFEDLLDLLEEIHADRTKIPDAGRAVSGDHRPGSV